MKLSIWQKGLIALTALLALFIITNPSASAFKEHLGRTSYQGLIRDRNYIIFSTYEDRLTRQRYNGVLENFIEVKEPQVADDTAAVDEPVKRLPISYKDRVYIALKETIKDFNTPREEFYTKIKDREYDMKVYRALKDNLNGFDKSPDEFVSLINN